MEDASANLSPDEVGRMESRKSTEQPQVAVSKCRGKVVTPPRVTNNEFEVGCVVATHDNCIFNLHPLDVSPVTVCTLAAGDPVEFSVWSGPGNEESAVLATLSGQS